MNKDMKKEPILTPEERCDLAVKVGAALLVCALCLGIYQLARMYVLAHG